LKKGARCCAGLLEIEQGIRLVEGRICRWSFPRILSAVYGYWRKYEATGGSTRLMDSVKKV
jgi:hypothetical protein